MQLNMHIETFNLKIDIDHDKLLKEGKKLALDIFNSPHARKDRSFSEIVRSVIYGLASEIHLRDNCHFTNDTRKYRDVLSPGGQSIEVKTTGPTGVDRKILECNKAKSEMGDRYADTVFIYVNSPKKSPIYRLAGVYGWNYDLAQFTLIKWDKKTEMKIVESLQRDKEYLESL